MVLSASTEARIAGLYAITRSGDPNVVAAAEQALAGGARLLQYREKGVDAAARAAIARALRDLCARHGAVFVVNDDLELAAALGCGVHLGREDAELAAARARLGPSATIGLSCYNDLARAERAERAGASYVAFGAAFPSRTKPGAVRAELSLYHAARARLALPIVAIGGITPDNAPLLIDAGVDAVAVIEGVFGAGDTAIDQAAAHYARLFDPP